MPPERIDDKDKKNRLSEDSGPGQPACNTWYSIVARSLLRNQTLKRGLNTAKCTRKRARMQLPNTVRIRRRNWTCSACKARSSQCTNGTARIQQTCGRVRADRISRVRPWTLVHGLFALVQTVQQAQDRRGNQATKGGNGQAKGAGQWKRTAIRSDRSASRGAETFPFLARLPIRKGCHCWEKASSGSRIRAKASRQPPVLQYSLDQARKGRWIRAPSISQRLQGPELPGLRPFPLTTTGPRNQG